MNQEVECSNPMVNIIFYSVELRAKAAGVCGYGDFSHFWVLTGVCRYSCVSIFVKHCAHKLFSLDVVRQVDAGML